jgi:hypothetical protein
MLKSRFVNIFFVLVIGLCVTGTAFAAAPGLIPEASTLKLDVTQSPVMIYPPIMIYTAQLNGYVHVQSLPSKQLKVDFYHLVGTRLVYLGSAPIDQRGKAVLSKQMTAGTYTAISEVVINGRVIRSNIVTYKVR